MLSNLMRRSANSFKTTDARSSSTASWRDPWASWLGPKPSAQADKIFEADITPRDFSDAQDDIESQEAAQLIEVITGCVDPDATVEAPLVGEARAAVEEQFLSVGFPPDSLDCFIDGLIARDIDGREMWLTSVDPAFAPGVEETIEELAPECM